MARDSLYPVSVKAGKPILGMLPTGWQKLSLEKCLNIEARKAYIQDNQEYDLVTVKRSRGGVIRREHLKGKDISVKSQFYIKEGDFLISKRQIVHGACGLVPKELSGSIVSNEYCVLTGKSGFYLPYMEFLSESLYFQQTCFHSSIGVHIEKMIFKLDSWFKWPFNIPPLSEQKRIVKILSTWDKAITVTEKLLVNSQQQKKALMQQLLTGKKRLLDENGVRFSGEWEKGKFCDMANIDTGYAFKSKDFTQSDSGIPIIRMSDFKTGGLDVLGAAKVDRDSVNGLDKFKLRVGDFVFGMSGSLNNYGRVEKKDLPCYLNQRVGRILAKECANQAFITYLYLSDSIQQSILDKAAGAAQLNISISDLRSMVVYYPCIEEQQKIAAVLSAADAEISTLEKKLACLRDEKKALMQQLLTGKRRVKVDEAVAE
ncbi:MULTISPECIES: restriction endonuclease subunit S [Klebsiella]|uniref:restriction endonuclease subunit S n=1 Tax=Klebsiella pneumoniae complex TaxID=3390273 RepID=UPI000E2C57F1|nr:MULTISPECIES: restriction endonuclease subunit S [Klebsiella]MCL1446048.1 restriction endonuclease subunit S [Klebsiella quasipneumoniae]MCM5930721.1 restriction endonuclease subunit S [Klebsiella pneumoniae]MDE1588237.1 restriction endonuclease subunit S [Klebsiella quasipneumoniae]MDE1598767.1 restriction endonuclease subunit S [Klebsiella quasipneumoniae]MDE1604108.1 restriction endonuclease subunit S [Klebsiella quasipneumoniae]